MKKHVALVALVADTYRINNTGDEVMSRLKELASANHPYYCSESNYYSNEASMRFDTMTNFLDEFEEADVDMNLCFRWDVKERMNNDDTAGTGLYWAEVFLMLQRKGKFMPCTIRSIEDGEAERFDGYLKMHAERIVEMWSPISMVALCQKP